MPRVSASFSLAVILILTGAARADDAKPDASKPDASFHWNKKHTRFRPVEYVITGVLGPVAIGEYFLAPAQAQPHWIGGILFDDSVRNALRIQSPTGLHAVWTMADTVGVTLVALSVGLDSIIVPLARGSFDVAMQLTLMDAESFALSSLLTVTLYDTVGRARPAYEDCQRNPSSVACTGSLTASFPSGHINEAFTAAGLSCAHHIYARVYGNRIADIFACVRDLTLGTTEALLRVMGDRHYMTDVIVGSAFGFGFGFALPTTLHYIKWGHKTPLSRLSVAPMIGQQGGVIIGGAW